MEKELERIEAKLRNVQLSLEILTSVCATLPDPEPSAEEEIADDSGEPEGIITSSGQIFYIITIFCRTRG